MSNLGQNPSIVELFTEASIPQRSAWRHLFKTVPALWPNDANESASLSRVSRVQRPDTMAPGNIFLMGFNGTEGTLVHCELRVPAGRSSRWHPAWRHGAATALADAHDLAELTVHGAFHAPESRVPGKLTGIQIGDADTIDGDSYGLPLVLACASDWLNRPIPDHIVATGKLGENGTILPIGGLVPKVRMARAWLQSVTTLTVLIPTGQPQGDIDELKRIPGVEFVSVKTVSEALIKTGLSLPDTTTDVQRNTWFANTQAEDAANGLFKLAFLHDGQIRSWTPYIDAAHWLLERYAAALPGNQQTLAFGAHVVLRHNSTRSPHGFNVTTSHVDNHPPSVRIRMLAHLMQHARDTGQPDPKGCELAVLKSMPELPPSVHAYCTEYQTLSKSLIQDMFSWAGQLFTEQLRMCGAWLRFSAADERHWRLCTLANASLVNAWARNLGAPEEYSYPLSELLRLASLRPDDPWIGPLISSCVHLVDVENPYTAVHMETLAGRYDLPQVTAEYIDRTVARVPHLRRRARMSRLRQSPTPDEHLSKLLNEHESDVQTRDETEHAYLHLIRVLHRAIPVSEASGVVAKALSHLENSDAAVVACARERRADPVEQASYVLTWTSY